MFGVVQITVVVLHLQVIRLRVRISTLVRLIMGGINRCVKEDFKVQSAFCIDKYISHGKDNFSLVNHCIMMF